LAAARARRGEPWRREAAAAPRAAAGATHAAGISTIVRGASVLAVSRRREVRRRPFPCVVGTRERRKALGRAVRSARGERGARSSASIRKEPPSQEIKSIRAMEKEKDLACLESQILNLVSQFLRERQPKPALRKRDTSSLFDAPFSSRGIVVCSTSSDTPRLPATMKIEEVQSTTKKQRVATHTHIKVRRGRVRARRRPIARDDRPGQSRADV